MVNQADGNDHPDPPQEIVAEELAEQVAWQESSERRRAVRTAVVGGAVLLLVALVGVVDFATRGPESRTRWLFPGIAAATWYVGPIGLFVYFTFRKRAFRARHRLQLVQARLGQETAKAAADELGIDALWGLTQARLDFYHRLATTQSTLSFNTALAAMAAGYALLFAAAVAATFARSTAGTLVAGALGVIGAGLSGFIASTFLRLQETSVAQLRSYFVQPVEFLRFLAAERLGRDLNDGGRDAALMKIIDAIVRRPADDQGESS